MALQKGAMEPGKKYRGYGYINDYKEFCFEPEETGKNQGRITPVATKGGVSLSQTKTNLIFHVKIVKGTKIELTKRVTEVSNTLLDFVQRYEF